MILLNSTKTLKRNELMCEDFNEQSEIIFPQKSSFLFTILQSKTKEELAAGMKIKNATLDNTYNYFQKQTKGTAITTFKGAAFLAIDHTLDINYTKENLLIIDALYGILHPFNQMNFYRLDFKMNKLLNFNLTNYWQEEVTNYLNDLSAKELLILLSQEYQGVLNFSQLNKTVYTISFVPEIKATYEQKRIRGLIYKVAMENQIRNYQKLDNLKFDKYYLKLNGQTNNFEVCIIPNKENLKGEKNGKN